MNQVLTDGWPLVPLPVSGKAIKIKDLEGMFPPRTYIRYCHGGNKVVEIYRTQKEFTVCLWLGVSPFSEVHTVRQVFRELSTRIVEQLKSAKAMAIPSDEKIFEVEDAYFDQLISTFLM